MPIISRRMFPADLVAGMLSALRSMLGMVKRSNIHPWTCCCCRFTFNCCFAIETVDFLRHSWACMWVCCCFNFTSRSAIVCWSPLVFFHVNKLRSEQHLKFSFNPHPIGIQRSRVEKARKNVRQLTDLITVKIYPRSQSDLISVSSRVKSLSR